MKRLLLSSLLTIICTVAFSQSQTFDCGLFSFTYPSKFVSTPIKDAPHMVLKLQDELDYFTASYWDYKIGEGVSIWDDELVEWIKAMPTKDGEKIVSVTKETIQTKGGNRRCLKIKSNIYRSYQGEILVMSMVYYNMISDGYLFVFNYSSPGEYKANTPTKYGDNLMKGLKFKTLSRKSPATDFESQLKEKIKDINEQCPFYADDCTCHESVILIGHTIMFKTIIFDECLELMDFDLFKRNMCESFANALEKPFVDFLDSKGYSTEYLIYNESGVVKKKVEITPSDILKFYKTDNTKKQYQGV